MRLRRLTMNVSQERLAEMLGLTFQQVQKYEKGVNRVAASRLWDVARALDVPVSYFFEGLDGGYDAQGMAEARGDTPVFDLIASPDGAQLAAAYATMNSTIGVGSTRLWGWWPTPGLLMISMVPPRAR